MTNGNDDRSVTKRNDSRRLKLNRETVAKLTVRTGLRAGGRSRGVVVPVAGFSRNDNCTISG